MLNKRLVRAVPESRKYIAGNVLCQWVSLLANIAMMASIAQLLAGLFYGEFQGRLAPTLALAVAAVAVRAVCTLLSSRLSYLSSKAVKRTLRGKIYKKLLRLGASYQEQVNTSRGGAGGRGGRGPAGDVFRRLPAPVLLRHAGAPDAVWCALLCELSRRRWCCSSACR